MAERIGTVLLATTGLYRGGGIASVSRCMLRSLEEEAEAGRIERVDILSLSDRFESKKGRFGIRVSARGSQLLFLAQACRMMRRRPDLLLLDHLGLGRAFRLLPPGMRPKNSAIFVHGTEFWAIQGGQRESVVLSADRLLTNSEFTAGTVTQSLPQVSDRVTPVLLCIDPELISRWQGFGAESDKPVREPAVLIVGRMEADEPGKGHEALLDSWATVRQAVPDAVLWIAGDGSKRQQLESAARELPPGSVEFLGKISDEDLSTRYRRASLFAMPSRQEGFGLVYAEAMWHGLPCIASTADAGREVVRDAHSGALVPYGDPAALASTIIRLLRDPTGRRKMEANAREEARIRFTYSRFREDFLRAIGLRKSP